MVERVAEQLREGVDERFMREALALARRGLDENDVPVVEKNPDNPKLQVMLPGFSYPESA
jgi:hypothetical protein